MRYRPEVDGLRAVAVLPVILFHAGFSTFSGGFVGVDVFFVISGYLITTIIVNELEEERFSIVKFYERRARRILPALFFVILVSIVLAWMFLLRNDFRDFFRSIVAVVTFSSNIFFWLEADYFDTSAELKPLLHTWSLAVEEQYYIIFPLLMMAIWRFGRPFVIGLLAIIFLLSLGYAEAIVRDQPETAFYLLPTRAWEIMVGAFCALYLQQPKRLSISPAVEQALSMLGLILIAVSIFAYSKTTPTPSLYMLAPTLGSALIILFANAGTVAQKILSLRGMVGIGLISYSAYLWHQPILSFTRHNAVTEPSAIIMLAASALSLALAWFTWRYVEKPFRNPSFPRKRVFTTSFVGTAALLMAGLFVHMNNSLPYGNGQFNMIDKEIAVLDYHNDNSSLQRRSWDLVRDYADGLPFVAGSESANEETDEASNNDRDWFGDAGDRMKVLLVGNSHSKDMFNILFMSETAAPALSLGRFSSQIDKLVEDGPFFSSYNYDQADAVMIATRYHDSSRGDVSNLEPVVRRLIADGKTVILIENIFEFPAYLGGKWTLFDKILHEFAKEGNLDPAEIVAASDREYYNVVMAGQKDDRIIQANAEIHRLKDMFPQIIVMNRTEYMCSDADEVCYSANENLQKYYPDYGHHTLVGAEFFAKRVDEINWLAPIIDLANERRETGM